MLKDKLSEPELRAVRRGFDIVGDIAIIEVPDELSEKEDIVADAIKKVCKNVRTVLRKMGERKGKYRLREFKILSGDGTETTHREYGYELRLDVTKVYFSPREAEERQRIAKMVKSNESVLVMFAGIGPYAIAIAKKQPNIKKVYAIEINPYAYRYMVENIRINKLSDKIVPILGDVSVICKDYVNKFDRIVMPLPKGAYKFIDIALKCAKRQGFIHFYHWAHESDLFGEALEIIKEAAEKLALDVKIIGKRKVLPYASRVWKICIDFMVQ